MYNNFRVRIAWDIDGVQADFGRHFLNYYNIGGQLPTEWDDERFTKNLELATEDSSFWLGIPKMVSYTDLRRITDYVDPVMHITARNVSNSISSLWLSRNGAPCWDKVITVGVGNSKVPTLGEHSVDIIIDDSYENYQDINSSDVKCECVLMTRSHNEKYNVDKRVSSLYEFYASYLPKWKMEKFYSEEAERYYQELNWGYE